MNDYAYILACADGTWYTGWTRDPRARLLKHNAGKGAKYTKARRPVKMIFLEAFSTKEEAMAREYAIKQLPRRKKEALVQRRLQESRSKDGSGGEERSGSGQGQKEPGEIHVGRIFYIMGKSAAGKDTIYRDLLASSELNGRLERLVIYTTRPIRSGERDGVEYHFTDERGLEALRAAGKVIELRDYSTVYGSWKYFTVDDESIDLSQHDYLAIGTLESYRKIRRYYGVENVLPIYIEVEDGIRLSRALERERAQTQPKYGEMCRRFLADQKDFAPEKLEKAGITRRFDNSGEQDACFTEIREYICSFLPEAAVQS